MARKSGFVIGEKVLCFHGPLLYEAKCLKKENKDKKLRYFVHYSGWKKNWDEWVPETRVLKCNDANRQKQKELKKLHIKSKKCDKKETAVMKDPSGKKFEAPSVQEKSAKKEVVVKKAQTKKTATPKPKPKPAEKKAESFPKTEQKQLPKADIPSPKLTESKGKSADKCDKKKTEFEDLFECGLDAWSRCGLDAEFNQGLQIEMEEEIKIPTILEEIIWEDYDLINNQKMVVDLPSRFTVEYVLASYVIDKVSDNEVPDPEKLKIREFANLAQECFDVLLGKTCLYKFEKPQYLDIHKNHPNKRMCEIYGATHLLRMFCKMDELLKGCNPPGPALTETRKDVKNFLRYLSENTKFFDEEDYEELSSEDY